MKGWSKVNLISKGGQGSIFHVKNEKTGLDAVLKIANFRRNSNERIKREILILLDLQDSNFFPKIIDYDVSSRPFSYIMEHGGITLDKFIFPLLDYSSNYYIWNLMGDEKKTGSFYLF